MLDAYPFCDGAFSTGVDQPLSEKQWVAAQKELLALIREQVPKDKWVIANAGRDFPEGSPFPPYLNGYLLENFLGSWGLSDMAAGLAGALLMDNTYFAFDYGPRNHGGVADYWFPQYYDVELGEPLGPYEL